MRRALFAAALLLGSTTVYADRMVTHHFESTVPASRIHRVIIEIPAGEVRLINSTGNTIKVSGDAKRDYDRFDEAYRAVLRDYLRILR